MSSNNSAPGSPGGACRWRSFWATPPGFRSPRSGFPAAGGAWIGGKWIAQLALPPEVVRWEWKRFRRHFVYLAAKVVRLGRRVVVRLAGSHRDLPTILAAHARLQI